MTWYSHIKRNEKIVQLIKSGLSPKEIKEEPKVQIAYAETDASIVHDLR